MLFREEIEYRREAAMGEEVLVDALAAGLAPDASRWSIQHRLWRSDGTEMAQVTVMGSWIDLETRKLATLPHDLSLALREMQRTESLRGAPAHPPEVKAGRGLSAPRPARRATAPGRARWA